jgi:hypothetical protein
MGARSRHQATPASSGLREVMAAKFAEHADRPGHEEFAAHWRAEQRKWESEQAVEVSCWEIPQEFRPPDAHDDYDRYRVGPAGELTLVERAADDRARILEQLEQLGR